jgi:hypothetical protein
MIQHIEVTVKCDECPATITVTPRNLSEYWLAVALEGQGWIVHCGRFDICPACQQKGGE